MTTNTGSKFANTEGVAQYFGVSTSTVRMWVAHGRLPAGSVLRAGTSYRFRIDAIEQHFEIEGSRAMQLEGYVDAPPPPVYNPDQMELDFGDPDGDELPETPEADDDDAGTYDDR